MPFPGHHAVSTGRWGLDGGVKVRNDGKGPKPDTVPGSRVRNDDGELANEVSLGVLLSGAQECE